MSIAEPAEQLVLLARAGHAGHCKRCLSGLPGSQVDLDSSRLALGFYCIGSLDLLGLLNEKTNVTDREAWKEWIWAQQTPGSYGTGFKPSSYMTPPPHSPHDEYSDFDTPHIIMTYTALLSLAILRDDFSRLDRPGLLKFLRSCQRGDGSFSAAPGNTDSDLRTVYCAFAISSMLDDWSGVNVDRSKAFIASCRSYEGGYGQSPYCEAQGGPTYIAIASLSLAPSGPDDLLTPEERRNTIRWLLKNQDESGGFRGRTGKEADACYCFWCGAALQILGANNLVDAQALSAFLSRCQFKYGGISKAPGEHPDPYHTYLSLAALAMYPPGMKSWQLEPLDPMLNANEETSRWARGHIPTPTTV